MTGLINIKNQGEDDCFKCCHLRLINPKKTQRERVTSKTDKEILDSLDYSDIDFPLKAKDHELVEERFNINVNILGYDSDSKKAYPLCISKKSNWQVLNVLLLSNGEKDHYVFINDIKKLLSLQLIIKIKVKKHICFPCLLNFTREDVLTNHKKGCLEINGDQAAEYEEGITKFSNYEKQLPIPFKIYADTECSLKNIDYQVSEHTKLYQWHVPNPITAKLACIDDRFTKPTKIFTGKKCIKEFLEWVFETYVWKKIQSILRKN